MRFVSRHALLAAATGAIAVSCVVGPEEIEGESEEAGSLEGAAAVANPTWYVDAPILYKAKAEPYDHYAVKDPTIVYSGGKYHMFYTGANASGGWQMLYSSATTMEGFRTAQHIYLSRIGESYFCAPQVFYFEPHNLWYLVYQDGKHGAAYATTSNIADPNSWSGPKSLGASGNMGWDYYVICDDASCYLYNTPDDGSRRLYVRKTARGSFPGGWGSPSVAITDTFEGAHVYKSLADGQYYLIVEDLKDNRYYELWTSTSAGGPWRQIAEKWAWRGNLVYNADRWTTSVSHGELIRAGVNQKLEINDINRVDFLIQGNLNLSGPPYQQLPWDLGVIRNYAAGSTTTPVGTIRQLQSYNFQSRYLRHQAFRARIDEAVSPIQDAQFRVVPGLANASAVSFESVNFPGRFLRHRGGEVWLDTNDGSSGFRGDATWHRRAGLANSGWSSFESYSAPGQYMRHSGFLMIVGTVSGSAQQADATFREQ
ncbi:non-reducing end alpha-L-arabinofuranosidase family hydrolase [Sorangium sp. So ce542]|uniref:non-reducing end alpha-L-arabinofuranosidase family hydrolase n=1 Tax=Sorangium sp. So ce542 TaxID=3133316 RepID=UPI003F61D594